MEKKNRTEVEKAIADKLGITTQRAAELIDKVEVEQGWTWGEGPDDQGKGTIACLGCGITATVRDPLRIASKCPGCGTAWTKIASVD